MNKILLFCFGFLMTFNISRAQTEVTFYTTMGDFVVECYDTLQPITAGNFIDLVNTEFYDGIIFHRVIDDFMIQGGDPLGTGYGGPGYSIMDEFDPETSNTQKTIAMANSGPNTGGSQFFINLVNNTYLDPNHPVFGEVIEDFEVVQSIGMVPTNASNKPLTDVIMDSIRVTVKGPYVGIEEEAQKEAIIMNVFPNPAQDQITINLGTNNFAGSEYMVSISNILGEKIYNSPLTENHTKINIASICPTGIYFVMVTDQRSNSIATQKIIVK